MSQALHIDDFKNLKPRDDLVATIKSIVSNGTLLENIDQAKALISGLKQPYHIDIVNLSYQKNIISISTRDGFYMGTQTDDTGHTHYNFTGQLQNLADEISNYLPCRVLVYALDEKSVNNSTSLTEVAAGLAKKAPVTKKFDYDASTKLNVAQLVTNDKDYMQVPQKEIRPRVDKFSATTINLTVAGIVAMCVFIGYSLGKNSNSK